MKKKDQVVLVFAKPPIPGYAKTRLMPALGAEGAAALHSKLVDRVLKNLSNSEAWDVQLWGAGDVNHSFFTLCQNKYQLSFYEQRGENLGDRMFNAMRTALESYEKVVIIGTDCPLLDREVVEHAFQGLNYNQVVINPAEDGGYVLLGLKAIDSKIFANVNWGTASVADQTFRNLLNLGWDYTVLPTLWDIDRPEDLAKLETLQPL